jgi:hypothetical protein
MNSNARTPNRILCLTGLALCLAGPAWMCDLSRYADFSPNGVAEDLIKLRNFSAVPGNQNHSELRKHLQLHLWRLFAGIFRPAPGCAADPVWRTWFSPAEAARGVQARSAFREFDKPRQIPPNLLAEAQSRGLIFSNVLFNQTVVNHIHKWRLFDAAVLDGGLRTGVKEIPAFPRSSAVVKTLWRHIPQGRAVSVGIWEPPAENGGRIPEQKWKHCVNVSVTPVSRSQECPSGPQVGVHEFYSIVVKTANLQQIVHLVPAADRSRVQPGDAFILLSLHLAAKEIPDWVWATWWWQPGAPVHPARPPATRSGVWRNYTGDITLSMEGPWESAQGQPMPNAIFNPFLEASSLIDGTSSNCMTCHSAASYKVNNAHLGVRPDRRARGLHEFERSIRTDYLWSVALRAAAGQQ